MDSEDDITIIQSSLIPLHVAVEMEDGVVQERTFIHSFRIGRSSQCEFQLLDNLVSRMHTEVCFEAGQWWVKDLLSTNGTYLNGSRVDRALLPPQAKLEVGEITKESHVIFWLGIQEKPSIPESCATVIAAKDKTSRSQVLPASLVFPLSVKFIDSKGTTKEAEFLTPFTLGRSPKSDFSLDVSSVSKIHVNFIFKKDQWWVIDAQSTNGIYLDRKKISQTAIHEKTKIELGWEGPVIWVEPQPTLTQTVVEQKRSLAILDTLRNRRFSPSLHHEPKINHKKNAMRMTSQVHNLFVLPSGGMNLLVPI